MHELRALRSPSIIGTLKRYWSIPLPFAGNGECIAFCFDWAGAPSNSITKQREKRSLVCMLLSVRQPALPPYSPSSLGLHNVAALPPLSITGMVVILSRPFGREWLNHNLRQSYLQNFSTCKAGALWVPSFFWSIVLFFMVKKWPAALQAKNFSANQCLRFWFNAVLYSHCRGK